MNYPNCEFEMATDLTSSSTSSSPVVVKILIDFDEYQRLLEKKEHLDRQEKKLKDQLETCAVKKENIIKNENVVKNENSLENIQTGSGTEEDSGLKTIDHGHLESILEKKIEETIRRYGLQPLPQQPSRVQSGGGSSDTFPSPLGQCHNEKL